MKPWLVRFTVRRMIVLVAIVAILFGAEGLRRRRAYFRQRALEHTRAEGTYGRNLEFHRQQVLLGEREARARSGGLFPSQLGGFQAAPGGSTYEDLLVSGLPQQRQIVERFEKALGYHAAMRIKYEGAAGHPWRTVGPDPPPCH